MGNTNRNVILVTGQSGMKINDILDTLKEGGFNAEPFPFEKGMVRKSSMDFLTILSLPPKIQESLWTKTFRGVKKKVVSSSAQYPILTFHASWYHQKKREFLSPVDFKQLQSLKSRAKMVVVFVDDCYDIYLRLMAKDEMYQNIRKLRESKKESDHKKALLETIPNLMTILTWREVEIAFSRKIARLLSIPFYIVAVKHPNWMLQRLIESGEEHKIFYLSHAISSILKGAYPRPPGFYQELNEFIKMIVLTSDEKMLPTIHKRILFIPDAIDEKGRLKQEGGRYVPELLDGWPLPFSDDWMFRPLPAEVKGIPPLNPGKFDFRRAPDGFQAALCELLDMLVQRIGEQITSRDISLVEQSRDGVIAYRPYWAATRPGGVEEELKSNSDLREKYDEKRRRTVIINTTEDLAKWRMASLFECVKKDIDLDDRKKMEIHNLCEDWLSNPQRIAQFQNLPIPENNKAEMRKTIEGVLPDGYSFYESAIPHESSTLRSAEMLAEREKWDKAWEGIFEKIHVDDPFRKKYIVSGKDSYIIRSAKELSKELPALSNDGFPEQKGTARTEGMSI